MTVKVSAGRQEQITAAHPHGIAIDNRPHVQRILLAGLDENESAVFMRLLRKATSAANERSREPLRQKQNIQA